MKKKRFPWLYLVKDVGQVQQHPHLLLIYLYISDTETVTDESGVDHECDVNRDPCM